MHLEGGGGEIFWWCTLPETNSSLLKMDWETSFLLGWLVLGRVNDGNFHEISLVKIVNRKQRLAKDGHLHRFEGTNFRYLEGMFGVVADELLR